MSNRKIWIVASFLFLSAFSADAQKAKREPLKHEKEVRDIVAFFQYMLNTLGDPETATRDKDVMITESFTKVFRDGKVQVEDDLDEGRNVITNKDVQAYLKDVDFFFKDVKFEFNIEDIEGSAGGSDKLFYKVKLTRNLKGTTVDGKKINSTRPRYIEINYNTKDQDLKIVSVYTNQFNESGALLAWWNDLSYSWREMFKSKMNLPDSVQLSDIKTVTSIDTLDVSNNPYIQTIEPLAQLLNLRMLDVSNTNIKDLTPIRNLTELVDLDLSETEIDDLSSLRYAINIENLNIAETKVRDISVLDKLVNLKNLNLANTSVSNFQPLKHTTQLQVLDATATGLDSVTTISTLTALRELNISKTWVVDASAISDLQNLVVLNVDSTRINDFGMLGNLKNLEVVHLNNTSIQNLDPLLGLAKLERVYCDHTGINQAAADAFMQAHPKVLIIFDSDDLRGWWYGLPAVWKDVLSRTAHISYNPSKEELARVTNLDSVNFVNYVSVKSLEPLSKLPKLKVINGAKSGISDLSPLKNHREITSLDISGTHVADISIVRSFQKLKILRADNSKVQHLDTLADLPSLSRIYADHANVTETEVQSLLGQHPDRLVIYRTAILEKWWSELSPDWQQVFRTQLKMEEQPSRETLHRLTASRTIAFENIPINDLSPLRIMNSLEELHFNGTTVKDLSPLTELKTLKVLHINDNPVRDLGPIGKLSALQDLDISNTPVDELDVPGHLKELKKLNCSGTQIKKLNPLKDLKLLEYLDCSNTDVKNIDDVAHLDLKTLKCVNTKVSKGDIKSFQKRNPECTVVYYR
jgi:hypothetical protein